MYRVRGKWLANGGRMYRVRGKWLANGGRMYRVRPIFQNGHFGEYSNLTKLANFRRVLEFDKFAGEWPLLSSTPSFVDLIPSLVWRQVNRSWLSTFPSSPTSSGPTTATTESSTKYKMSTKLQLPIIKYKYMFHSYVT